MRFTLTSYRTRALGDIRACCENACSYYSNGKCKGCTVGETCRMKLSGCESEDKEAERLERFKRAI
jgi:hypothetical protein